MYPDLKDKVAIVTGAGRKGGLGEAIARKLAANSVRLVLHDVNSSATQLPPGAVGSLDELAAIADSMRSLSPHVSCYTADMREETEVVGLVAHAVRTFGRVDILVNNAGVGFLFGPLVDTTQEHWDTVLNVNLRGAFFAIKHAAKQMLTQEEHPGWGRGRIVSIGSRASKSGSAFTSSYVASKHGLIGLTRSAAVEFGPHNITVNAVCPNHVTTQLGAWQNEFMAGMRGQSVDAYLEAMRARIPLGRVGEVDDTANACAFLCSGEARYITGEGMNVSGGEEMH
jgi:meso-butanediol dehydrogenase/(S,S)-butanediol dehydrogenase/diacetyl reductase